MKGCGSSGPVKSNVTFIVPFETVKDKTFPRESRARSHKKIKITEEASKVYI